MKMWMQFNVMPMQDEYVVVLQIIVGTPVA